MSTQFLSGRTALITGGGSGIGRAIAQALAAVGAQVAIGSRSSMIHTCAAQLESQGYLVFADYLDVTTSESVQHFYEAVIAKFGQVDILVNSAGATAEQSMVGHPDDLWNHVMDVNLQGVYRTIKCCLPGMIDRKWGRIINLASTAATVGSLTNPAYCASKAAVVGLTRCVALEGAPHGVTCNAISPGWVETDFGNQWMQALADAAGQSLEDYRHSIQMANPQQRIIQPEEVGALAAFLCTEGAIGLTMQDITLSAGSLW